MGINEQELTDKDTVFFASWSFGAAGAAGAARAAGAAGAAGAVGAAGAAGALPSFPFPEQKKVETVIAADSFK